MTIRQQHVPWPACIIVLGTMLCVFILPPLAADNGLQQAIYDGDVARVTEIVDGIAPERAAYELAYPLNIAADAGEYDTVKLFLDRGAYPDSREYRQRTPLHNAALQGHLDICRLLIARGADVNARTDLNFPPLENAIANNHLDVMKLLLEHGAEPNYIAGNTKTAPMHQAVLGGHLDMVSLLIEHGCDINAVDSKGVTPLMQVIEELHICGPYPDRAGIITLLLSRGTDVNAMDTKGRCALSIARQYGLKNIESQLLQFGAKPLEPGSVKPKQHPAKTITDRIAAKLKSTKIVRQRIRDTLKLSQQGNYEAAMEVVEELDELPEAGEYADCYKYIALVDMLKEIKKMTFMRSLSAEGEGVIYLDGVFDDETGEDESKIDVYFVDF